jgi:hypothetical protein
MKKNILFFMGLLIIILSPQMASAISLVFDGCGSVSNIPNGVRVRCSGSGTCATIQSQTQNNNAYWKVDINTCSGSHLRWYLMDQYIETQEGEDTILDFYNPLDTPPY